MKTALLAFLGLVSLLGVATHHAQAQTQVDPSYQYQCQFARSIQNPTNKEEIDNANLPNGRSACPVGSQQLPDPLQQFGCPDDDGYNKPDICYGSYRNGDMACSPRPEKALDFYNCYWGFPGHLDLKPMKVAGDPTPDPNHPINNPVPTPPPNPGPGGGFGCPSPSPMPSSSPSPATTKPTPKSSASPSPCLFSPQPSPKPSPKLNTAQAPATKAAPVAVGATGVLLLGYSIYLAFK